MNKDLISIQQSNGLLRKAMNQKIVSQLFDIIKQNTQSFLAEKTTSYQSLQDLYITQADKLFTQAINKYLGQQNAAKNKDAAKIARMGGSLFQNLRIYRDIIYTQQSRQSRLLGAMQEQLYKAYANKELGKAYI